jgi:hypothetical protein
LSYSLSLILASSLLSASAVASRAGSLPRADGPELAMEITSRDFGDVFDGEELEQNFPVRNVGTSSLEFSQKSTLSRAGTNSNLKITAAVWHPGSEFATRPAAAMLAAPT